MKLTSGRTVALAVGLPLMLGAGGMGAFSLVTQMAHTSEDHTATYDWTGGEISVDTSSGNVRVEAGGGSEIVVAYTNHYSFKKPSVSATTSGGGLQLKATCNNIVDSRCQTNFVVTVPESAPVVLHTGSGSVRLTGVSGSASLRTGSGGITLDGVSGDVVARTGSGSIKGTAVTSSSFEARTGDGGIRVDWAQAPAKVAVRTGSGSVRLTVPEGSGPYRTTTHTGSGSVHVNVPTDPAASASIEARTGDGGISIGVPAP